LCVQKSFQPQKQIFFYIAAEPATTGDLSFV